MLEILLANNLVRTIVLILIFGSVVLGVFLILSRFARREVVQKELERLGRNQVIGNTSLSTARSNAWTRLADRIEGMGLNLSDSNNRELRDKLVAAGFDSPSAPKIFTLARLAFIFILPMIVVVLSLLREEPPSILSLYIFGCAMAVFGLFLPNLVIAARADRRREKIVNGFPDCLDLLLVCVEAGLGLEAAFDRVGREMIYSHPLVARMLLTSVLQLRAGATRESALRQMGEKSGVDEIRSFSTLLIQSDKLGTSISTTLRVYAAEMREKRRMRAEEKAHRIPVLISIPLVTCMLPVMIGVLMLPAAVGVVRQLIPAMTGG